MSTCFGEFKFLYDFTFFINGNVSFVSILNFIALGSEISITIWFALMGGLCLFDGCIYNGPVLSQ
jgi:1,4-dihydroxy-2-naphthoate octaprenyltransferase